MHASGVEKKHNEENWGNDTFCLTPLLLLKVQTAAFVLDTWLHIIHTYDINHRVHLHNIYERNTHCPSTWRHVICRVYPEMILSGCVALANFRSLGQPGQKPLWDRWRQWRGACVVPCISPVVGQGRKSINWEVQLCTGATSRWTHSANFWECKSTIQA